MKFAVFFCVEEMHFLRKFEWNWKQNNEIFFQISVWSNLNMMQLECYVLFIGTIFQNPPNFPQYILIISKHVTKLDKSYVETQNTAISKP